MDHLNGVLSSTAPEKLKLTGSIWLGVSLFATFGSFDLGGFLGLLAVLAVVLDNEYLLKLFLVFTPISLMVNLYHLFYHSWSAGWLFLQLIHFLIMGASVWFAYLYYQEIATGGDSYTAPSGSPGGQRARQDPFAANAAASNSYVPPAQNNLYQQQAHTPVLVPHDGHNAPSASKPAPDLLQP